MCRSTEKGSVSTTRSAVNVVAAFGSHRCAYRPRAVEANELAIVSDVRNAARQTTGQAIEAALDLEITARIAMEHDLPEQIERRQRCRVPAERHQRQRAFRSAQRAQPLGPAHAVDLGPTRRVRIEIRLRQLFRKAGDVLDEQLARRQPALIGVEPVGQPGARRFVV
jgi:hypothetical protein